MPLGYPIGFSLGAGGERPCALAINGIDLSTYVAIDSASREPRNVGERRRTFNGGLRNDLTRRKQALRLSTVPVSAEVADALRGLLRGDGEHWPFEADAWSLQGSLATFTGATIGAGGKHDQGANFSAVDGTITFPIRSSEYTVALWRREPGGSSHDHWLIRSDGTKWKNSVADATSIASWWSTTATVLTISNGHATLLSSIDDLVVLPYMVPSEWKDAVFSDHSAHAWPSPPKLTAAGDLLAAARSVVAFVEDAQFVGHVRGGSFVKNNQVLNILLEDA